ncbi:MAG: lipoate--protein ligase family protein [Candidatus Cloacimonetes bacterium]|nr:lipoate--protein ligase family protein [Candidatus Cloacimonadota bacterium]
MRWRILKPGIFKPYENMAIDEAVMIGIANKGSEPTIRFYDWDPPTVSCGYNQAVDAEVDFDLLERYGYGFVRRPTGGRLVLHEKEVTYAVIAPLTGRMGGKVQDSYAEISRALALGLQDLGMAVAFEKGQLSVHQQRIGANPCFSSSSRYELAVRERKIVGSAQVRRNGVLLQHGSVLLDCDQSRLAYLLPGLLDEQRAKLADFLASRTLPINQELREKVNFATVVTALSEGFRKAWSEDDFYRAADLTDIEKERVRDLVDTKYLTDEWNKRK